jgi:hypothetical protein
LHIPHPGDCRSGADRRSGGEQALATACSPTARPVASSHWADPKLALTPDPVNGLVLIAVEYRVSTEQASDFIAAMDAIRIFRRREGAVRWDFFRDLADLDRYEETFVSGSWGEHMRQHTRVIIEEGVEPVATHLIAARAYDRRTPAEPPYGELS